MELIAARAFLVPLLFALFNEIRATILLYRLNKKYGISIRRNYFGRVSIGEIQIAHNSFEDPKAKKIMRRLIVIKRWILIWLGLAIAAFLLPKYIFS